MRINNDVRNYVRKEVKKRGELKRGKLVEEVEKVRIEYNKRVLEKREVIKAKLKQLCSDARTELIKYAKSIGCKCKLLNRHDSAFVSGSNYDVENYITVDGENLINEATERLHKFDISVNEKVDEILFKLSLGGDYDSIVKEINNIKF